MLMTERSGHPSEPDTSAGFRCRNNASLMQAGIIPSTKCQQFRLLISELPAWCTTVEPAELLAALFSRGKMSQFHQRKHDSATCVHPHCASVQGRTDSRSQVVTVSEEEEATGELSGKLSSFSCHI